MQVLGHLRSVFVPALVMFLDLLAHSDLRSFMEKKGGEQRATQGKR